MAKCEVIGKTKVFEPVTLQITLETEAELEALYNIVRAPSANMFTKACESTARRHTTAWGDWDSVAEVIFTKLEELK